MPLYTWATPAGCDASWLERCCEAADSGLQSPDCDTGLLGLRDRV